MGRKESLQPNQRVLLQELEEVQTLRARRVYAKRRSRLDPYQDIIILLINHGASYRDIQRLLRRRHVVVSHTTIRSRVLHWQNQAEWLSRLILNTEVTGFVDGGYQKDRDDTQET